MHPRSVQVLLRRRPLAAHGGRFTVANTPRAHAKALLERRVVFVGPQTHPVLAIGRALQLPMAQGVGA